MIELINIVLSLKFATKRLRVLKIDEHFFTFILICYRGQYLLQI